MSEPSADPLMPPKLYLKEVVELWGMPTPMKHVTLVLAMPGQEPQQKSFDCTEVMARFLKELPKWSKS